MKEQDIDQWEILGKELTIADVLRALYESNRANVTRTRLECSGDFSVMRDDGTMLIITRFNLSLPLSHPDNAEPCEKVLAVLNKGV
ncbi:hypothetical protein RPYSC3_48180 [Rhodopseudomonas palustris]|nr:hypothetical protein RPYSC3_48180 [Rhodopseudomonas palustris]